MIVDLAVESELVAFTRGAHGLMTCGRQVDDREPAVPHREADVTVKPITEVIRAPMSQCARHGGADALHVSRASVHESGDPAHVTCYLLGVRPTCGQPPGRP